MKPPPDNELPTEPFAPDPRKPVPSEPTPADADLFDPELVDLLDAVLDLPAEERKRHLEAHARKPEWVELVESMLRDEAKIQELRILEPIVGEIGSDGELPEDERTPASAFSPGEEIGFFRILELLGEGGMGRVYRAEQREPIRREVALKVVREALDPQLEPRFLAERQALGRLAHSNIARLYEAGATYDGRPYVAMELVTGTSIVRYSDEHRLSIRERLRLFAAVCRGAQHAHEKQILHRDLKPSNILVTELDGQPVPKIIDFGIAKTLGQPLVEHTLLTGQRLIGTPYYMSPEALERDRTEDLDTRSDVYSLGVVLYELLAGQRPFRTPTAELPRLIREILDVEAPRPSQSLSSADPGVRLEIARNRATEPGRLAPLLATELDWVVMKAMAKDRGERYASAAELANELERVLAGEPVLARPPSVGYRLGKWAQRHRLAAGLGALTAIGLVLATILTSMALVRAQAAEQKSREEAQISRQALDFVVELFEAASPKVARGESVDAQQLLEIGTERIRDTELAPLPRAEILSTLAQVRVHLGQYDEAIDLANESLEIRQQWLEGNDPAVLSTQEWLVNALRRAGRHAEAEPLSARLVEAARRAGDPLALAAALNTQGNVLWSSDRIDEAEAAHREALEIRIAELGEEHAEVAGSHNNLGVLYLSNRRYAEAEPHFRRAADLLEASVGRMHPNTAHALNNLGVVEQNIGKLTRALETHRGVLEIRTAVLGPDHPSTSATHSNMALLLRDLARYDEAEQQTRRALEIRTDVLGPDHGETLKSLAILGHLLSSQERFGEAEEVLDALIEKRQRLFGPESAHVARSRRYRAELWRDTGRIAEARKELRAILDWQHQHLGEDHWDVAMTAHELAVLERRQGELDEARQLLDLAIAIRRDRGDSGAKALAESLVELAEVATLQGLDADRATLLAEALEIRRRIFPEDHPDLRATLQAIGNGS